MQDAQPMLDLTQKADAIAVKTRISAHHKRLGYGDEGDHRLRSVRLHLRSESVSDCKDKLLLLTYERHLEKKK